MGKGQELYKKAKTLIPGGHRCYQKDPSSCCPRIGRHIIASQRDVAYGILTVVSISTAVLWVWVPTHLDMLVRRLMKL